MEATTRRDNKLPLKGALRDTKVPRNISPRGSGDSLPLTPSPTQQRECYKGMRINLLEMVRGINGRERDTAQSSTQLREKIRVKN